LNLVSPGTALGGHTLNALLLGAIVLLGASLASRLSGKRAGAIAGVITAVFGSWPLLVGWVSGAQDLLAIAFVLVALNLELSGRSGASLAAFCCAVLSKETAVAAAPALVATHWLRSRSLSSTQGAALRVLAIVTVWGIVNPGVRALVTRGGVRVPGTYIGLDHPKQWVAFLRYVTTLFGVPPLGYKTSWPSELTPTMLVSAVPLLMVLWFLRRDIPFESALRAIRAPAKRDILGFGLLLCIPPILATSVIVQNWAPYYACFSIIGFALIAGSYLSVQPFSRVAGVVLISFILGIWSRGVVFESGVPSERDLRPAANALSRLEKNFKRVAPTLPQSCIVYVSVMATNKQSVYTHMHTNQVLRFWYRDPSIQVLRPELCVRAALPEALFCVEPSLDVFQVDLQNLRVRSATGPVDRSRYRSVMTSYAIGLAGVDELQHATEILLGLSPPNTWEHVTDVRVAAMLLLSRGEIEGAAALIHDAPMIPTRNALEIVAMLLTAPERGTAMEEPALLAFGFSPKDPKAIRPVLRWLLDMGYLDVSERLANRLQALVPGDPQALAALGRIRRIRKSKDSTIVPPIQTIQFPSLG